MFEEKQSRTKVSLPLPSPQRRPFPGAAPQFQRQTQIGQQLVAHTLRPVALQRQQISPVFQALSLRGEADRGLTLQRQAVQEQIRLLESRSGSVDAVLQRQAAGSGSAVAQPGSLAAWVQAARLEVQRVADPSAPDQTRWLSGAERERHVSALRSIGHGLVQGFKADQGPAVQRYEHYGDGLATLQRQALTAVIPRMVLAQVSPGERSGLQRAVDEALQRQQEEEARDASSQHLHGLQRQLANLDQQAEGSVMERIQARRGSGAPLAMAVRRQLEAGLNHDLSGVRIHTDAEADLLSKKVNATAFTTGQDIYFQSGRFDPNSQTGVELLAHEAAHTVQQSKGQVGQGIDPDAGLEHEARVIGRRVARQSPAQGRVRPSPALQTTGSGQSSLQRQVSPSANGRKTKRETPAETMNWNEPGLRANHLLKLLSGVPTPPLNPEAALRIDQASRDRHVDRALSLTGRSVTANLLGGTTRTLATRPAGSPDRMQSYRFPVISTTAALAADLSDLKRRALLSETLKLVEIKAGKSIYALLGERVKDTSARTQLLQLLPQASPISQAQLTRDAFLENLAVNFVYSNDAADKMNTKDEREERRGANPAKLLDAFGYRAGPPLSGRWGFQMRVFSPDPVKAKGQPVIVAFRGTEGIAFDAVKKKEGTQDTIIGDFAPAQPGYNQFDANAEWIGTVLKAAAKGGRVTFVGHSLGGALAQIAAARYPQLTGGVVTFQAANIKAEDAARIAAYNKAQPKKAIEARHYRIDGDVVPTSGEAALPGEIYYFNRVARPKGSASPMAVETAEKDAAAPDGAGTVARVKDNLLGAVLGYFPLLSVAAASKGHVVPMLSTAVRQQGERPGDAQREALLRYGQRDENELPHMDAAGKPTPRQDVGVVLAGNYDVAHDPRLRAEASRTAVMPSVLDLTGSGSAVFKENIAYNTLLGGLFDLAKGTADVRLFKIRAHELTRQASLPYGMAMRPEDQALAAQLHLKTSQRGNAVAALKNVANFDQQDINADVDRYASGLPSTLLRKVLGAGAKSLANSKYNKFIGGFPQAAALDAYRGAQAGQYQVNIPVILAIQFQDDGVLTDIWHLYHPESRP